MNGILFTAILLGFSVYPPLLLYQSHYWDKHRQSLPVTYITICIPQWCICTWIIRLDILSNILSCVVASLHTLRVYWYWTYLEQSIIIISCRNASDLSQNADIQKHLDEAFHAIAKAWKESQASAEGQKPKPTRSAPRRDINGVLNPVTAPRKRKKSNRDRSTPSGMYQKNQNIYDIFSYIPQCISYPLQTEHLP